MRDLLVFTWNLRGNVEAAKLAISHLSSWPNNGISWIAAFQEAPRALDTLLKGAGNVRVHDHDPATDHNVILSSDDIVLDPDGPKHARNLIVDRNHRMAGRTFACAHWSGLRFLSAHGKDRLNWPTDGERQRWATTVRRVLTSFWSDPAPLIVAGDLNANPWHHEVTDRSGWFAGRPGEQPGERYRLEDEDVYAVPLVNPMWRLVAGDRTPGTFHDDHDGLRWHCLDQVLVSRDLATRPLVPVIRGWLSNRSLVDEAGKPLRGRVTGGDGDAAKKIDYIYSDHLPVEMILSGEVVARACDVSTRRR
ncbi:hypothetical protein [Sorangium sp. So ce1000]|uniref:hypothetical protein n=1 Tax=Sorangium sp. So ce1000 TaxID=3133325 RepID=UPI003F644BE3